MRRYRESIRSNSLARRFGGPVSFLPTSINGCQLWLDSSDNSSLVMTGANVTTWKDKTTNKYIFTGTGAVASNIPSSTNTSLYFNGSSYLSNNSMSITNPYTIFTVAYQSVNSSSNAGYQRILNGIGPTGSDFLIAMGAVGTNVATFLGFGGNWNDASANIPLTQSLLTTNIICSTVSVGTITTHVNGITLDSKTGSTNPNFTGLNIGGGWGTMANAGLQTWTGHVCEVIHYHGVIDRKQRQQVEGYLAWKWGLQATLPTVHPYSNFSVNQINPFLSTDISGCAMWLDGNDPIGTGVEPTTGTAVSTWVDKSGTSNNGTSGSATFLKDSLGGYLNFTGSQTYNITNPNVVVNQYFTIFVVEQIQNYNPSNTLGILAAPNEGPTNTNLVIYYNNSTNPGFAFYGNDIYATISPGYTTNAAQPTRIWSASFIPNSRNLYINGVSIGADTNNTFLTAWSGAQVGYWKYGNYTGKLREIIIYSGTINSSKRQQVEGYLAWKWGLISSLPNSHPYKKIPPGLTIADPSPKYSALFNTANNSSLTIPANAALTLGTNNHTIEFWLYQTSRNQYDVSFSYGNTSLFAQNNYFMSVGSYIGIVVGNGSGNWAINIDGGAVASLNEWHHYAIVRNGTTFTFYLNGINRGSATSSVNIPAQGDVFRIGNTTTYPIAGYISNFRLVNGTAVYTSNFTPPTSPLTAIPNTQVLIQGLVDNSPNAFTVTNNGGVTFSTIQTPFT